MSVYRSFNLGIQDVKLLLLVPAVTIKLSGRTVCAGGRDAGFGSSQLSRGFYPCCLEDLQRDELKPPSPCWW